ncbi:MAG TPA: alpha/beta hydrolase [Anaerolineaceae bacterium]
MSVILIDQKIVHYEVLGRGRPIIFLHGWVGSWRYWIPAMQAASVNCRAYALDLWGFGDTQKDPQRYSLARQAELVDRFLDQMGIGRVALVGHGLGAAVALLYARTHPEVVDRVLTAGCPLEEQRLSPRLRTTPPAELADWLLGKTPLTEPARSDAPKTDPAAVLNSLSGLAAAGLRDITTPCLLVYGQNDPVVPPPEQDLLSSLPEQIHVIWFEQSGHFPMLDEGNKFSRLLADFIALPSGESPRQLQLKEEWKRRVR